MRLMRIGEPGHERPVLVCPEGRHYDLSGITEDIDGAFLAALADNPHLVPAEPVLPETDITGLRIGAPVARPSALLCIGQNYAAHAAESGAEPPEQPILFYKSPNTVVGPYDDVLIPRGSKKTDWEVELAVVIGRRASYLDSPADAAAHRGLRRQQRRVRTGLPAGGVGRAVVQGQELRDVQPAGPGAGDGRRGRRPAAVAAAQLRQR